MKIIDFEKKGNVIRFYLGEDNLKDWYGDDWNDVPYEHNAGEVYDEFVTATVDFAFDFDCLVLEPKDDWHNSNSNWCKEDMRDHLVPCLLIVPSRLVDYCNDDFGHYLGMKDVYRIYFGDSPDSLQNIGCGTELRMESK